MALDFGTGGSIKAQDFAFSLPLGEPDAEESLDRREVLVSLPGGRFVGMASLGPATQLPEDESIQPVEGSLGGSMAVIVGPAPDKGVEFGQELLLWECPSGLDTEPDFVPQGLTATLCGGGQEFVPKLAHGVPQEVEPVVDGGDDGLLL